MPHQLNKKSVQSKLIGFIKQDVLAATFAQQALMSYCNHILENKDDIIKQMNSTFISGKMWVGLAQDFINKNNSQ